MSNSNLNPQIPEEGSIDCTFDYSPEEVFQPLEELRQFNLVPKPFLVILTSGLEHLEVIKSELVIAGIKVEGVHDINNFETFARHIYPIVPEKPHSHLWLIMNRQLYGNDPKGKALILPSTFIDNYEYIAQVKRHIRNVIGIKDYKIKYNGQNIELRFHHLHAPDFDELSYQYNCLLNFSNSLIEP